MLGLMSSSRFWGQLLVQHAGSGESTLFQDFCELQVFVKHWTEAADEPVQTGLG